MGWRHGLVGFVISKIVGRAADVVTGGDPLDPDREDAGLEELPAEPVHRNRRVEGLLPREKFKDLIAQLDARLDEGFRGSQADVLRARAAKLKQDQHFVLMCNVYHDNCPTGLQVMATLLPEGLLLVLMEGRGPAMDLVKAVFEEQGARPKLVRDGSFVRSEEDRGWYGYLPASQGVFLGQEINVFVEDGWAGVPEGGDPGASPFLQDLLRRLPTMIGATEGAFRRFVEEDAIGDVADPWMIFPADASDPEEWYL